MQSVIPSGHATLSASGSGRWIACPGSVAQSKLAPASPPSPAAEEGTAAHEAGALCLQEGMDPSELIGRFFKAGKNQYEVTEEMAEAIKVYTDYIARSVAELKGCTLYVEHPLDLSFIRDEMWGTADSILSQPFGELRVVDYKHGSGVVVEVKDNTQALYYALGALEEMQDDPETVRIVIVQPRAMHEDGPIRDWVVTPEFIRKWGDTVLGPAADLTRTPGAGLHAGTQCRWCDAAAICPELQKFTADEAAIDFADPQLTQIEPLESGSLSVQHDLECAMKALPVVEAWCKSVGGAAQQWLESGNDLDGFKLVRGKSNRVWKDEEQAIKLFKRMKVKAVEYLTVPKLISPAQAEKVKKIGKNIVEGLAEKPEGKLTIALMSDKRNEVAPPAQTDFDVVEVDFKVVENKVLDDFGVEEDFLA